MRMRRRVKRENRPLLSGHDHSSLTKETILSWMCWSISVEPNTAVSGRIPLFSLQKTDKGTMTNNPFFLWPSLSRSLKRKEKWIFHPLSSSCKENNSFKKEEESFSTVTSKWKGIFSRPGLHSIFPLLMQSNFECRGDVLNFLMTLFVRKWNRTTAHFVK